MDLQIKGQVFLVCGATSGFGSAIAHTLLREGANIIALARTEEKLKELEKAYPGQVESLSCDITQPESIDKVANFVNNRQLHGILVNAGGPPAKTVMETQLADWDQAYHSVLRWKIALTLRLVPYMQQHKYGRIIYIESASVKQPMENLVLSNSIRLAVVGFVKTLSQELAKSGVTLNIMAPGSHNTAALERIFAKRMEQTGITREEAVKQNISNVPVGFLGQADDFASLASWLFSPHSRFVTGQTISVDGGSVRGIMG